MRERLIQSAEIDEEVRLDVYASRVEPDLTRTRAKALIEQGLILLNGLASRPSRTVRPGDSILLRIPDPEPSALEPEDIPLDIIYEDSHLVAVNKAPGLVVHPAAGHSTGTLVHALLNHCRDLSGVGGVARPGIVHRLDKGTSGVIVAAKDDPTHLGLSAQFKDHTIRKEYRALVFGVPKDASGVIRSLIARHPQHRKKMASGSEGRESVTRFRVIEDFGIISYLSLEPETGRTHQIRVHLSEAGHPIIGDPLYGGARKASRIEDAELAGLVRDLGRPALHAFRLRLIHPATAEPLDFRRRSLWICKFCSTGLED